MCRLVSQRVVARAVALCGTLLPPAFAAGAAEQSAGLAMGQAAATQPAAAPDAQSRRETLRRLRAEQGENPPRRMPYGLAWTDCYRQLLLDRQVTPTLCQELDALAGAAALTRADTAYVETLMHLLGAHRDPGSRPTLERFWQKHPRVGLVRWLGGWTSLPEYYLHHAEERQALQRAWSPYFVTLLDQDLPPDTVEGVVQVAHLWFHDDATTAALIRLRDRRKDLPPGVAIRLESALRARGAAPSHALLDGAIKELLASKPRNLVYLAARQPQAEFVPPLLEIVERSDHVGEEAERVLRGLTFARPGDWRQWYAQHGPAGREAWLAARVAQLRLSPDAGPQADVLTFLRDDCLTGGDVLLLPLLDQLADEPEYAVAVGGLLAPRFDPHICPQVLRIIDKLLAHETPREQVRRVLANRNVLPGTWEEAVNWMLRPMVVQWPIPATNDPHASSVP
jgi:hypothetical protein